MRVSVCLGAICILIPEYLDFHSSYSARRAGICSRIYSYSGISQMNAPLEFSWLGLCDHVRENHSKKINVIWDSHISHSCKLVQSNIGIQIWPIWFVFPIFPCDTIVPDHYPFVWWAVQNVSKVQVLCGLISGCYKYLNWLCMHVTKLFSFC